MRIAVVIPEMGTGGAEAVAGALARHHVAAGHEVTLFSSGGWRMPALEADGVRLHEVPLQGRRLRDLVTAIRRLRRADLAGFDTVHAHNAKAALAARAALGRRRSGPALLVTAHGFLARDRSRATRLLAGTADHVVAVSEETADRLYEHGLPADRVSVIENAIEPPARHDRAEARRRLGLTPDEPVVLCLARMTVQKRHDLLLDAWLDWSGPPPTLLVAGDGPTRPALERRLRAGRGAGAVRMLGDRQDADWLLAAADVLVLPSDMEGLPLSVLEAMTLGVPVVASAVGGLVSLGPRAVELVPPGDGAGLREGVRRVLVDERRRAQLVTEGRALLAERFALDRMLAAYDDTVARVTGPPAERT
jgi:glycosyltransferase involved in cell wall biosynthesis